MNKAENAERVLKLINLDQQYQINGVDVRKLELQYADFIGLSGDKFKVAAPQPAPMVPPGQSPNPVSGSVPNEVQQFQQANAPGLEGMNTTELTQQAQ
jgi:hypothetical protein